MPQFLADECFAGPLLRALLAAGFDVARSSDWRPGASDGDVLAHAFSQGRVLITEDKDFGDLVIRLRAPAHGVVRVDLKSLPKPDREVRIVQALSDLGAKVEGSFVTIEPTRTRLRALPERQPSR